MHIGVDYDDTVFEFMRSFLKYFNERNGTNHTYESMNSFTIWPTLGFRTREEAITYFNEYYHSPDASKGSSLPGSYDVCKKLKDSGHTLSIVSARPRTTIPVMNDWLTQNMRDVFSGVYVTDQFSHVQGVKTSKGELCERLGIKVMIDDATHYLEGCAQKGIRCILIDRPWNRTRPLTPGIDPVASWSELSRLSF